MADVVTTVSIEQVEEKVKRQKLALRKRERRAEFVYPLLVAAGLMLLWEVGIRTFGVPEYLFPTPSAIIATTAKNWTLLLNGTWITTIEILLGYFASIVIGVPLALAIFHWPVFAKSIYPLLISTQAMPKVAVAPLLVVWFGFGLLPKVLIAFLIAFFPIVINTIVGLASLEREKIHLAQSMGLSRFDTFRLIRLPHALPSLFAGLKISITLAVVGAVVGEFVGGDGGLGYQLMVANGAMDTPLLFAGIVVLTVLGLVLFWMVEAVERWAMPYQDRTTGMSISS